MTSAQFLELFLSLFMQAAIVVVVAHALSLAANSEDTKCRIWAACHALLLLLLGAGLLLPHLRVYHPWSFVDQESAVVLLGVQQKLGSILFCVWIVGFMIALVAFIVRSVQMNHFLQACQSIDLDAISIDDVGNALIVDRSGKRRAVRLLKSPSLASPCCWQFHRPCIVVPDFFLNLDAQQIQFILRHELAHLQSGHPIQLFVQRIVEMIYWFHPMVWWSSYQSAIVREFACDAAVVDSPSDISVYLQTLLTVIQMGSGKSGPPSPSISFGTGKTIIAKRAQRLVLIARGVQPHSVFRFSSSVACSCLLVFVVLVSLVRLPVDILASTQSSWSPWPTWSAEVLHNFGIHARDFEAFDHRLENLHERLQETQHVNRD